MKWLKHPLVVLSLLAIVGTCCAFYYQTFTTASYETVVFNAVTGPTISPVPTSANPGTNCRAANTSCSIQNTGMGSHELSYCIVGGNVTAFALELEGSNDLASPPGNWIQISNQDTSLSGTAGCGVLEGGGYYQYLRANLITFSGTGSPKLTAWYSGIGNAIPGGGLNVGLKASQPVTFVPDTTYENNAVSTTPQTVISSAASIDTVTVGNANAGNVFLTIGGIVTPSGGVSTAEYMIPASSSIVVPISRGFQVTSTGATVACSTAVNGSGAPATGCLVTIHLKPFVTVNSQVSNAGTVNGTAKQIGP